VTTEQGTLDRRDDLYEAPMSAADDEPGDEPGANPEDLAEAALDRFGTNRLGDERLATDRLLAVAHRPRGSRPRCARTPGGSWPTGSFASPTCRSIGPAPTWHSTR
jgi:hypothetical protein